MPSVRAGVVFSSCLLATIAACSESEDAQSGHPSAGATAAAGRAAGGTDASGRSSTAGNGAGGSGSGAGNGAEPSSGGRGSSTGGQSGATGGSGDAGSNEAGASGSAPTSGIVPADRLPPSGTWEGAGIEGGIPDRSTVCAVVTDAPFEVDATGATSAVAGIQAAIDACPDGEAVLVPAGSYLIDGALELNKPITLRGAGSDTSFSVQTGTAIHVGGLGPWPPPKANPDYHTPITGGAARGSDTVAVADTTAVEVGKMVMIDEEDDPELVWTKADSPGRYRASMHLVDSKTATSVTFHPPLLTDFTRSPQLSWFPDFTHDAGIEGIQFVGTGTQPDVFIEIYSAYNSWVKDCEFSDMPNKTIVAAWSSHLEFRRIYLHDQANGGPNSEGLDLLCDVNFSLIVDNVCVAGGFPQINIGDGGANPNYSGGMGNVIAYNYAVDAFYTDPPTADDAGKMPSDISTNHSPHSQFNLVEGNVVGRFGSDAYHGSGSHTLLFRNLVTGSSSWQGVDHRTAIQIDRRNLSYSVIGNVLGLSASPATLEYATESGWNGSTIYRLGFPDMGNDGYSGTYPPTDLVHGDGGPRDLYVDRTGTPNGTTLIEGNWNSASGELDFSDAPVALEKSYFLRAKPAWFGSLPWPPVDPNDPMTDELAVIPAAYRYLRGADP